MGSWPCRCTLGKSGSAPNTTFSSVTWFEWWNDRIASWENLAHGDSSADWTRCGLSGIMDVGASDAPAGL